jgi:two-component system OmpR family sensor kinase
LLAGTVVLVALGLVGTDLALSCMLGSFLSDRVDRQLDRVAAGVDQTLSRPAGIRLAEGVLQGATSGGLNLIYIGPDTRILTALPRVASAQQVALVTALEAGKLPSSGRAAVGPIQVNLAGTPYHVLFHPTTGQLIDDPTVAGQPVEAIVVAISFGTEQDTLDSLAAGEALIGAIAMLMVTGLAIGILRLGLRPVSRMAATATAIAEGETMRRVPVDRPDDEVGQLAVALNRAFDERSKAEDSLRRFIADASHELRTPLTTIRGWADLYLQGGLREPARVETAMARIVDESDQVSRLVEELLLLARLDERRPLDATSVDLAALVDEVGRNWASSADRDWTIDCDPTGLVSADPEWLELALDALIENAVHFTDSGEQIQLSCWSLDDRFVIAVADSGAGIAAEDLSYVFQRFWHRRPVTGPMGSGLGLPMAQAAANAHDGHITAGRSPIGGALFELILPRKPAATSVPVSLPAHSHLDADSRVTSSS